MANIFLLIQISFSLKLYANDNNSNSKTSQINLNQDLYLLGPGDVIRLNFYNTKEFSSDLEIMPDGSVNLPFVGQLYLQGNTLNQASLAIREKLGKELLNPLFQLTLVKYRPIKVALIGEVKIPGIYSLTSNELSRIDGSAQLPLNGFPTLVDSLQKAGGISQTANLKDVKIKRLISRTEGKYKIKSFNLIDLIKNGNQLQNPYLFDGDIISIPKANTLNEKVLEISSANLSPKVINVHVLGEVTSPGNYNLPVNTPLLQSILRAGGVNNLRTNKSNVEIIRINRNGTIFRKKYKINFSKGISVKYNPPLQDGDFVYVRQNLFAKSSDAIEGIAKPMTGLVTIWSLLNLIGD